MAEMDAAAYIKCGKEYWINRDYNRAIADLSKAISLDPNNAEAYAERANAYSGKCDWDRDIADLSKALTLSLDQNDAATEYSVCSNRAYAYLTKGDFAHAVIDFEHTLPESATYSVATLRILTAVESLT